jgi:hypothetical protein
MPLTQLLPMALPLFSVVTHTKQQVLGAVFLNLIGILRPVGTRQMMLLLI